MSAGVRRFPEGFGFGRCAPYTSVTPVLRHTGLLPPLYVELWPSRVVSSSHSTGSGTSAGGFGSELSDTGHVSAAGPGRVSPWTSVCLRSPAPGGDRRVHRLLGRARDPAAAL